MTKRPHLASKPAPTARAILWKPLEDAYHLLASMLMEDRDNYTVFATQPFLTDVAERVRADEDDAAGVFGLTRGRLYRCPRTGARYAVMTDAVPLPTAERDETAAPDIRQIRQAVESESAGGEKAILGWYGRRADVGVRMARADEQLHAACFTAPWQTALVLAPTPPFLTGGFYLYSAKAERSCQVPFYELVDAAASKTKKDRQQRKRTVVEWSNYVADEPIVRAGTSGDALPETGRTAERSVLGPLNGVLSRVRVWVAGDHEER